LDETTGRVKGVKVFVREQQGKKTFNSHDDDLYLVVFDAVLVDDGKTCIISFRAKTLLLQHKNCRTMATMSTTTFMNTNLVAWIIMMFIYASSLSSVDSFFVRSRLSDQPDFQSLEAMVLANTKNIASIQGNITQSENRIIAAIVEISIDLRHLIQNVNTTLGDKIENMNKTLSEKIENVNKTLSEKIENVNKTLSEKIDNVNKTLSEKIENVDKKAGDILDLHFWVQCIVSVASSLLPIFVTLSFNGTL
jgi:hypothetical protein